MKKRGRNFKDLTGMRFTRIVVLRLAGMYDRGRAVWVCRCDCGTRWNVPGVSLRWGRTKSCGCHQRDVTIARNLKHGHALRGSYTRTYNSWRKMRERCSDPNDIGFRNYGGRGIIVCKRWINSFENFLADKGECPEGMTIDRINNDGNYTPSNTKWATRKQQRANRRDSRKATSENTVSMS